MRVTIDVEADLMEDNWCLADVAVIGCLISEQASHVSISCESGNIKQITCQGTIKQVSKALQLVVKHYGCQLANELA